MCLLSWAMTFSPSSETLNIRARYWFNTEDLCIPCHNPIDPKCLYWALYIYCWTDLVCRQCSLAQSLFFFCANKICAEFLGIFKCFRTSFGALSFISNFWLQSFKFTVCPYIQKLERYIFLWAKMNIVILRN